MQAHAVITARSLLVCALANEWLGLPERSRELEARAAKIETEGYGATLATPRAGLALARGELDLLDELLADEDWMQRQTWFSLPAAATRLDVLAVISDAAAVEPVVAYVGRPGSYLEPFALRATGIVREDESGEKRLVAYVVPEQADEESENGERKVGLSVNGLREHLLGKLPEYMVPAAYVQVEKIPLNHNGKIDRNNLPQPATDTPEQEYVGPRNATEETLCRLWQEVLRRERVGIHDNFFRIGGHSLMAAQAGYSAPE